MGNVLVTTPPDERGTLHAPKRRGKHQSQPVPEPTKEEDEPSARPPSPRPPPPPLSVTTSDDPVMTDAEGEEPSSSVQLLSPLRPPGAATDPQPQPPSLAVDVHGACKTEQKNLEEVIAGLRQTVEERGRRLTVQAAENEALKSEAKTLRAELSAAQSQIRDVERQQRAYRDFELKCARDLQEAESKYTATLAALQDQQAAEIQRLADAYRKDRNAQTKQEQERTDSMRAVIEAQKQQFQRDLDELTKNTNAAVVSNIEKQRLQQRIAAVEGNEARLQAEVRELQRQKATLALERDVMFVKHDAVTQNLRIVEADHTRLRAEHAAAVLAHEAARNREALRHANERRAPPPMVVRHEKKAKSASMSPPPPPVHKRPRASGYGDQPPVTAMSVPRLASMGGM